MTVLSLFPARIAVGYATVGGQRVPIYASPEFIRALGQVFDRIGGAEGPSTTDLSTADDEDSGTEEMKAELAKALDSLAVVPPDVYLPADDFLHPLPQEHAQVDQLMTEIAGLREEVAALRQQITDIQQGTAQ